MKTVSKSDLYRKLPSVDELLRHAELADAIAHNGHVAVADAARAVLGRVRNDISGLDADPHVVDTIISGVIDSVRLELQRRMAYSLRPVINATGVILHTNLGRAPLTPGAIENIQKVAAGYSNLELDLPSGERGKRDVHVERLFHRLFGDSENAKARRELSTVVVNNNAAAVWLALNTLAARAEVIVSRGELVEIGGSFRIPDVMAQSNATLHEVGTTNRTRIGDYEQAINQNTRVLLRVHRSNFQITGFTEQPALEELVALARSRQLILVEDLGSGAIFSLASVGIRGEPTVSDSLRAGVDVVTYSGDKLLGGPQAGMLTGRANLIKRMRSNSLFRALRVDKLTYAALEATLLAYVKEEYDSIPALRMMRASKNEINERAETAVLQLRDVRGLEVEVIDGESVIGGGAAPSSTLSTRLLAMTLRNENADALLIRLRSQDPPLIARTHEGRVLIDLRTVFPEQDGAVISALRAAAQS